MSGHGSDELGEFAQALAAGARELGLSVPPEQLRRHLLHCRLVLAHNARAGLTAITHLEEMAIKHFLDSLAGLLARPPAAGERVADIGSGGGFPGLVLAVACPEAQFTLLESVRKRARFLELAVAELGVSNVSVVNARAEAVAKEPPHRESYDLALARAVAPLPRVVKWALPLLRPGGQLLAYAGPRVLPHLGESEPRFLPRGRARLVRALSLQLPRGLGERRLLVVEKTPARG